MKLLILGGTRFVGRHLVTAALARNHEITLFNRGKHNVPDPYSASTNIETIQGDRNNDLDKLQGRHWDAVIDTCGYLPRSVTSAAASPVRFSRPLHFHFQYFRLCRLQPLRYGRDCPTRNVNK